MYVVTHSELTAGYQIAQIAHAVADFAVHREENFRHWHETSQYIVALQTDDADSLKRLIEEAPEELETISFFEPDLDYELTSVAFVPHERNKKYLSKLKLAGKSSIDNKDSLFTMPENNINHSTNFNKETIMTGEKK